MTMLTEKRRIYVCGPMRGYPRFNFDKFAEVTEILRDMGHEVINPAEYDLAQGFDPDSPLPDDYNMAETIKRDIDWILNCEDLVILPDWEFSVGATAERALAIWLGRGVYYWETIEAWALDLL